jgi:hypothetical protein
MIPGGHSHDWAGSLRPGKLIDGMVGAAKFERSHSLKIFALEEDTGTNRVVQFVTRHHRRDLSDTVKRFSGLHYRAKRNLIGHESAYSAGLGLLLRHEGA